MQDAKQDASGCSSGQGSQLKEPQGLLVVKFKERISELQALRLRAELDRVAIPMGLKALVMEEQMDCQILPRGLDDLVKAIHAQTAAITRMAASNEALVQAMAEAEGVEPEDVPATVGLNGCPL